MSADHRLKARDYVLGRLAPAAQADFEDHLADCTACVEEVERAGTALLRLERDVAEVAPTRLRALWDRAAATLLAPVPALAYLVALALLLTLSRGRGGPGPPPEDPGVAGSGVAAVTGGTTGAPSGSAATTGAPAPGAATTGASARTGAAAAGGAAGRPGATGSAVLVAAIAGEPVRLDDAFVFRGEGVAPAPLLIRRPAPGELLVLELHTDLDVEDVAGGLEVVLRRGRSTLWSAPVPPSALAAGGRLRLALDPTPLPEGQVLEVALRQRDGVGGGPSAERFRASWLLRGAPRQSPEVTNPDQR